MKIRVTKIMYDGISKYALENDITFDEALLCLFTLGEDVISKAIIENNNQNAQPLNMATSASQPDTHAFKFRSINEEEL
jgi:hypothetical protein